MGKVTHKCKCINESQIRVIAVVFLITGSVWGIWKLTSRENPGRIKHKLEGFRYVVLASR